MFKALFGLGAKSPDAVARVKAMITQAYRPGLKLPRFALMKAEIDALSAEEKAALYDFLETWWDEARAFALTHEGEGPFNAPENLLRQLIHALQELAWTSPERARLFMRCAVRGIFVGGDYNDISPEWVVEQMAEAGVVLDDPADQDLIEDFEAQLALRPLRMEQYKTARAHLARVAGGSPPTLAEDVATFDAVMSRSLDWVREFEAWRDRLLASTPDGTPPIQFWRPTAAQIRSLDPPEGIETVMTATYKYPPPAPLPPETEVQWRFQRFFTDARYRFITDDWFQTRAAAWRAWRTDYPLKAGEPELAAPAPGSSLERLWEAASSAQGARPSAKWLKSADALIRDIGREQARTLLIEALGGLRTPQHLRKALAGWRAPSEYEFLLRRVPPAIRSHPASVLSRLSYYEDYMFWLVDGRTELNQIGLPPPPLRPAESDVAFAKGAAWMLAAYPDDETVDALERVALSMLTKIAGEYHGPQYRSLSTVNACVWAMGQIGSVKAVTALGRIKRAARDERLASLIDKAMAEAAQLAGVPVVDLEEIATPVCGLEEVGRVERLLGDYVVTLAIESGRARLSYATVAGKALKASPAALKGDEAAAEEIKALKQAAVEIDKTLPLIKQRLEDSYLSGRDWSWDDWRSRWLDHPLAGALARRLIWRLQDADGTRQCAWDGVRLRDRHGSDVEETPGVRVRLWHPLMSQDDEIADWRAFLMERRIVQPFAQAHRQLYPLTPAERDTERYSNRFAGHILRQHQYMMLAKSRGWSARHKIWADAPNGDPTYKLLPAHGVYAQWWLASPQDDAPAVTESQAFVYVHSDRVLFGRLSEEGRREAAMALDDVDPLVFSEIMREVDLCVAVASIGNDPAWVDGGRDAAAPNDWRRHADAYWTAHANAPLDVSARVRAEVLAQILPSLAFADRFALDGHVLRVQGKLSAYRIHLGSANVMMEPSDRYLCIVPAGAAAGDDVYLPFEGDRMLSIILSKALMLVRDDKVADPGIVEQIRAGIG